MHDAPSRHVLALSLLTILPMQSPAKGDQPSKGLACDAVLFLSFDQEPAPASFLEAIPVSTEYEDFYRVTFVGPAPGDGGAVLDETIGFGVSGHTSPNFLAFDETATYADLGVPRGPQTLEFMRPNNSVLIEAGLCESCGDSGNLSLECFDEEGESLGNDSLVGSESLQALQANASGILSCELSFTSTTAVFDNLQYVPCDESVQPSGIPTLDSWGLLVLSIVMASLGIAAVSRRRLSQRKL